MSDASAGPGSVPDETAPGPPGAVAWLAPGLRRVVAPNPGPFTQTGTCTYIVGRGRVAVVDPGPDSAAHRAALLAALDRESVEAVLVTHTHRDHSAGAPVFAALVGAPTLGEGAHRPARLPRPGDGALPEAGADRAFVPDRRLTDGERVEGPGWALEAVATPGHCATHLAFALHLDGTGGNMLSGDHVMAWSTTMVAPPDGSMDDYMASLERLLARDERVLWPGHGGPVRDPPAFLRALLLHRRQREAIILAAVQEGTSTLQAIADRAYPGLAPLRRPAAILTTLAHLESLAARGLVREPGTGGQARYAAAGP